MYTVTSCGPSVTNCPAGLLTTEIYAVSTTVGPATDITEKAIPATSVAPISSVPATSLAAVSSISGVNSAGCTSYSGINTSIVAPVGTSIAAPYTGNGTETPTSSFAAVSAAAGRVEVAGSVMMAVAAVVAML